MSRGINDIVKHVGREMGRKMCTNINVKLFHITETYGDVRKRSATIGDDMRRH